MARSTEAIRPSGGKIESFMIGIDSETTKDEVNVGDVTGEVSSNGRRVVAAESEQSCLDLGPDLFMFKEGQKV